MTTILVSIDGVRPDGLTEAKATNFLSLKKEGAWTLKAQSVMPSITLPCHTSTFHSVPPTRHGITSNDWHPMARPLPGLIELAHAVGLKTAFIYNWDPLRNLCTPLQLDFTYFRNNTYTDVENGDIVMATEAVRYLQSDQPDFIFVYLSITDTIGHRNSWMSDEYLLQIRRSDKAFGLLLEAMDKNDTILVHADHGGHDRSHGTDLPEDMTIPWLIKGPGIKKGHEIQASVSLLSTAPTLAKIMGFQPHRDWEGDCLDEIFE